jgi:hypothetical protein
MASLYVCWGLDIFIFPAKAIRKIDQYVAHDKAEPNIRLN